MQIKDKQWQLTERIEKAGRWTGGGEKGEERS